MDGVSENRLTSCPTCTSTLIAPDWFVGVDGDRQIIVRCCPECGHADTVMASPDAAAAWRRRAARQRVEIAGALLVAELEDWLAGRALPPTASA